MRVFVASQPDESRTRPDDFSFTLDGELVWSSVATCQCPDCGCQQSMAGMASSRATTVFTVRDIEGMTPEQYRRAMWDAALREGWVDAGVTPRDIATMAAEHEQLAEQFEPDAALRRIPDGDRLRIAVRQT